MDAIQFPDALFLPGILTGPASQEFQTVGLKTGDAVTYHTNGAASTVEGLVNNTVYYVIKADDQTIKLAVTKDDATKHNLAIDLTPASTAGSDNYFTANTITFDTSAIRLDGTTLRF